jgi:hypothetical protein
MKKRRGIKAFSVQPEDNTDKTERVNLLIVLGAKSNQDKNLRLRRSKLANEYQYGEEMLKVCIWVEIKKNQRQPKFKKYF